MLQIQNTNTKFQTNDKRVCTSISHCSNQLVWISSARIVSVPSLILSDTAPWEDARIHDAQSIRTHPRGSKKAYHWLINHDELSTCPRLASLLLTTITRLCPSAKVARRPLTAPRELRARFSFLFDGVISRWKSELSREQGELSYKGLRLSHSEKNYIRMYARMYVRAWLSLNVTLRYVTLQLDYSGGCNDPVTQTFLFTMHQLARSR